MEGNGRNNCSDRNNYGGCTLKVQKRCYNIYDCPKGLETGHCEDCIHTNRCEDYNCDDFKTCEEFDGE